MKRFLLPLGCVAVLALNAIAADSPKDAVKAAAKKLGDKPNYSFTSAPKSEGGGERSRFQSTTEGKLEKDGFAIRTTKFGDNSYESVYKGGKGVVKTDEGWRTSEELAQRQTEKGKGEKGQGRGRGFGTRSIREFKAPHTEAAELADKAKDLKEADGAISGALSDEAVKEMLSFGGRDGQGPQISSPKGTVKFWIQDGVLSKYETNVQGKVKFNDQERDIDRSTIVTIKEVGSTKVTVPDEAKNKLK